jgi:hypothetical protein
MVNPEFIDFYGKCTRPYQVVDHKAFYTLIVINYMRAGLIYSLVDMCFEKLGIMLYDEQCASLLKKYNELNCSEQYEDSSLFGPLAQGDIHAWKEMIQYMEEIGL